jgi:hypothetical protein
VNSWSLFRARRRRQSLSTPYAGGRQSTWNSYTPIYRYVAQIIVEVLQTWRQIFIALVMKLHFPNHKRSAIQAALTVVAVLAIAVLAKLDATIQLFHTSH